MLGAIALHSRLEDLTQRLDHGIRHGDVEIAALIIELNLESGNDDNFSRTHDVGEVRIDLRAGENVHQREHQVGVQDQNIFRKVVSVVIQFDVRRQLQPVDVVTKLHKLYGGRRDRRRPAQQVIY